MPFIGATSPTIFGVSVSPVVALASPAVPAPAPWVICINGPISMLTGIAPIWATDITDSTGTAEAADCTPATSPGAPTVMPCTSGPTAAEADVANPAKGACKLAANPTKSTGGAENGVKLSATAVAP